MHIEKHILVVQSENSLRSALVKWLQYEGYQVAEALSGRVAIEGLVKESTQLIICEHLLCESDGFDFLRALRADEKTWRIPILVINIWLGDPSRYGEGKGSAVGWLKKPAVYRTLKKAILQQIALPYKEPSEVLVVSNTAGGGARLQAWTFDGIIRQAKTRSCVDKNKLVSMPDVKEETSLETLSLSSSSSLFKKAQVDDLLLFGRGEGMFPLAKAATPAGSFFKRDKVVQDIEAHQKRLKNDFYCKRLDLLRRQSSRSRTFENLMPSLIGTANRIAEIYNRKEDLSISAEDGLYLMNDHHFERLVEELVDNAFKYSKNGDSVEVAWYVQDGGAFLVVRNESAGTITADLIKLQLAIRENTPASHYDKWGLRIAGKIAQLYGGNIAIGSSHPHEWSIKIFFPDIAETDFERCKAAVTGTPFPC